MPYRGPRLAQSIPQHLTIWQWLFESDGAILQNRQTSRRGGYRDASTGEFISFVEIEKLAVCLSDRLYHQFGVRAGTGICIFASNSIWYPVAVFAAVRSGAIVTASSPEYGPNEAAVILEAAKAKVVFVDQGSFKAVSAASKIVSLDAKSLIPLQSGSVFDAVSVEACRHENYSFGAATAVPAVELAPGQSNRDVCAFLSFTSGTTSYPKGVMISHHNVIAQIMQMTSLTRQDLPRKILLGVLPFYHITGLIQIIQLPIKLNQEVILMSKFEMKAMLDTIEKYKCDELWLVPPLLIRLLNDSVASSYDLLLVKQFNTGAAPLAKEIIDKLAHRFPHIAIRQAWGMTETTSAVTVTPPALQTYENAHTVGSVVPDTLLKVIDVETGRECVNGESGEIWVKGPQITMGYSNNSEATAETYDKDGFLHTGDIGRMEPNGLLMIEDRLKEMIKVKGVAVAPAELEGLLLGHPYVSDVAVMGIPDLYAGELVKAFVVLTDKVVANIETERTLLDFVRQNKSRNKWLAGGVTFVNSIPKSASGKILRRVLKAEEAERRKRSLSARL